MSFNMLMGFLLKEGRRVSCSGAKASDVFCSSTELVKDNDWHLNIFYI